MTTHLDTSHATVIQGILDDDRLFVQLVGRYPPYPRMRRLMVYHPYELWETPVPSRDAIPPPFTALVWLVEVVIEDTLVNGYIWERAVVSSGDARAILRTFLEQMRRER